MTLSAVAKAEAGDRMARGNALTLAVATGLAGANATVVFATGGLVGHWLTGELGMATIPLSAFALGTALATYPIAFMARHLGRRNTFFIGNLTGIAAGLASVAAIHFGLFELFCVGTFLSGAYHAVVSSYRYAAADTATPALRPKAISWVLTGGVAAAVLGPQLVILTQDASPGWPFMVTYLVQAAFAAAAMLVTRRFQDQPMADIQASSTRPFAEIALSRRFIVAVITGTMAQVLMNFVMTAAPLAMHLCGHSVTNSSLGIQWHVIAMYAPSFFTGSLIARYGKERVAAVGLALLVACSAVNLAGLTVWHFWIGLTFLGIGWNLAFIAATAMVTDCHTPAERAKVQGFNDFVIFGTTAVGSFLAGLILAKAGWGTVNALLVPIALVCIVLVMTVRDAPAVRPAAAE